MITPLQSRIKTVLYGVAMLALLSSTKIAFAQSPPLKDEFEEKSEGWLSVGPHAKAAVTTETGKAKTGKGALEFLYRIGESKDKPTEKSPETKDANASKTPFDILMRAIPDGALAKMRSLRFSVKSDIDAPLLIALTEKDGGRYNTIVWVSKGEWRDIALAPEEFILAVDKNDPKDPDGKLDLDKVENIGITNVMAIFAPALSASSDGGLPISALHLGEHTLLIDNFTASPEPLPAHPKDDLTIDSFETDTIHWFAIGDTQMRVDKAAPQKGNALRLDYKQGDGVYVFMVRAIPGLKATEKDGIVLDFASAKGSRINITLEEKNGAHYTLALAIPGDNEPYHRLTDFSEFNLGDNTEDPKGHLDPTEIKSITISDSTGALGIGHQKNTLWIGPMSVKLAPKK